MIWLVDIGFRIKNTDIFRILNTALTKYGCMKSFHRFLSMVAKRI